MSFYLYLERLSIMMVLFKYEYVHMHTSENNSYYCSQEMFTYLLFSKK